MLVVSVQGVLGKGTAKQKQMERDVDRQGVNFLGSSLDTRTLYGVLKKRCYDKDPAAFDAFLDFFALDAQCLTPEGVGFDGPDGQPWHLGFLGSLGDWPWHQKSGHLKRTFNNVSKHPSSQRDPICHCCAGGMPGYPWEDMSLLAEWIATIGRVPEAWVSDGPLLRLVDYVGRRYEAYRWDLWHGYHMGTSREFLAGTYVESLSLFEGSSVNDKLQALNDDIKSYLQQKGSGEALSFVGLTREKLSWTKFTDWPKGSGKKLLIL